MGFFSRVWGYVKALVTGGVESRMRPEVQIEQAMAEARKQDLELRNQAARVIAHRTELQMKLDRAIDESAEARAQAGQALKNADSATTAGDSVELDKWTRTAQALAMKLESTETLVEGLKTQYSTATQQAELAKEQVNANALRLQELSAKRMELLGKLEQAKMQEQVNQTLEQLSKPMESNAGPTLKEIEDKINRRMAGASARAELESSSHRGRAARRRALARPGVGSGAARQAARGAAGCPLPLRPGRQAGRRPPCEAAAETPAEDQPGEQPAAGLSSGQACSARMWRKRRLPNSRNSAAAPSSALNAVTATWAPTEYASSDDEDAWPASTITSSACCAPAPPGVIGSRVEIDADHEDEQRVGDRRVHVERLEQEVRRAEPAAPAERLEEDDAAEVAARLAQDHEALLDAQPERAHVVPEPAQQQPAGDERDRDRHHRALGVAGDERPLEGRRVGQVGQGRQAARARTPSDISAAPPRSRTPSRPAGSRSAPARSSPATRLRTVAILTTSPPRAGAKALMPTPATYAPSTMRFEILSRGKAALMIAYHAFVRRSRFAQCSVIAISRASTSPRTGGRGTRPAASKKLRIDSISRSGA